MVCAKCSQPVLLYSSNSRRKDLKRVRTNTQVSDMRVLHIDTFARLSAKATHERQTFLRELRNLKKVPTNTSHIPAKTPN